MSDSISSYMSIIQSHINEITTKNTDQNIDNEHQKNIYEQDVEYVKTLNMDTIERQESMTRQIEILRTLQSDILEDTEYVLSANQSIVDEQLKINENYSQELPKFEHSLNEQARKYGQEVKEVALEHRDKLLLSLETQIDTLHENHKLKMIELESNFEKSMVDLDTVKEDIEIKLEHKVSSNQQALIHIQRKNTALELNLLSLEKELDRLESIKKDHVYIETITEEKKHQQRQKDLIECERQLDAKKQEIDMIQQKAYDTLMSRHDHSEFIDQYDQTKDSDKIVTMKTKLSVMKRVWELENRERLKKEREEKTQRDREERERKKLEEARKDFELWSDDMNNTIKESNMNNTNKESENIENIIRKFERNCTFKDMKSVDDIDIEKAITCLKLLGIEPKKDWLSGSKSFKKLSLLVHPDKTKNKFHKRSEIFKIVQEEQWKKIFDSQKWADYTKTLPE